MNSKKKILLVDDEIDILDFLSYNLINSGYDVRTAINGEEGIKVAREFNPDLILLDMMMPVMDGFEACRQIRNYETEYNLEETPIIAVSASVIGDVVDECEAAGMNGYISKPFKKGTLVKELTSVLESFN